MKGIGLLVSVSLLAAMVASPLAAQSTERSAREKQAQAQLEAAMAAFPLAAQSAEGSARVKQAQAQLEAVKREAERAFSTGQRAYYAEAVKGVNPQPQITLGTAFWRNAEFAKMVGLTEDQKKRMEDVFQQSRLKLIDLNGALAKEESVLKALMADLRPEEETRVLGQIDRVAQVRTELEKANARMLLGLRQVLTTEQWSKLSDPTSPELRNRYRF